MLHDPDTDMLTLNAGAIYRVLGEEVIVTRDYPREGLAYYQRAFHCRPGRYPLEAFHKLLAHVKTYQGRDTRKLSWVQARGEYDRAIWNVGTRGHTRDSEFGRRIWEEFYVPALRDDQPKHWPYDPDPYPVRVVQTFKHLKEKPVPQYQALLPVDLEKHLYSGSTLYDLEKHEFRKISSVTKASLKAGYTTTVTFVGGAKRIFKTTEALEDFAKGHKWVSLRDVPSDDPTLRYDIPTRSWVQSQIEAAKGPDTVHHYSRTRVTRGDTGITHIGWESINELIDEKIKEALVKRYQKELSDILPVAKPKRRWFS